MSNRLSIIISSWYNYFLSKASDPKKILDNHVQKLKSSHGKMHDCLIKTYTQKNILESKIKDHKQHLAKIEKDLDDNLLKGEEGDDEISRQLIDAKLTQQNIIQEMVNNQMQLDASSKKMLSEYNKIEILLDVIGQQKDFLILQLENARNKKEIVKILSDIYNPSSLSCVGEIRQEILQSNCEADAILELRDKMPNNSGMGLISVGTINSDSVIDQQLKAMKQKLLTTAN